MKNFKKMYCLLSLSIDDISEQFNLLNFVNQCYLYISKPSHFVVRSLLRKEKEEEGDDDEENSNEKHYFIHK